MNSSPHNFSERHLKQAIAWFVCLQSENCQTNDTTRFEQWLAQKPAHQAAYQEAERVWGNLDSLKQLDNVPGLAAARSAKQPRLAKRLLTNVALILAFGITWAGWLDYSAQTQTFVTDSDARSHITLADDSQLDLNVNTRLIAKITPFRRIINLEQGEALFTVSHEPLRPFSVTVNRLQIHDIGTQFNVQVGPAGVDLAVLEGEVELNDGGTVNHQRLLAGSRVSYREGQGLSTALPAQKASITAWLNGELMFKKTPLRDVTAQLEHYHPVHFVFADPELANQTLSGTFASKDLMPFLHALETLLPVQVAQEGGQVILHRATQK